MGIVHSVSRGESTVSEPYRPHKFLQPHMEIGDGVSQGESTVSYPVTIRLSRLALRCLSFPYPLRRKILVRCGT